MYKITTNYLIANIVSTLNLGLIRGMRFIRMPKSKFALRLLFVLYKQGVLRTFIVKRDFICVYYKYVRSKSVITKLSIVSKPSKRCYWTLGKLSLNYSKYNFAGFYIISTQRGLFTSDYCLTMGHLSGEVLIKVEL